MLYNSLVLRRTKDILELPGQEERVRVLKLSEEERNQYDITGNILNRYIRQKVGEHEDTGRFGLFQAHMQLRILCNHGTHQKLFSWKRRSVEDEREAYMVELGPNAEGQCAVCHQPRPIINFGNARSTFVENCAHILCADCLDDHDNSKGRDSSREGDSPLRHCPLCRTVGKELHSASFMDPVDATGDVAMENATEVDGDDTDDAYFNPSGRSTKMDALIKDVKEAHNETVTDDDGEMRKTKRSVTIQVPLDRADSFVCAVSFSRAGLERWILSKNISRPRTSNLVASMANALYRSGSESSTSSLAPVDLASC